MSEQIRLTAKFWPGRNEYNTKQNFRMYAGNIGRQQVLRVVVDGYVNLYEAELIEFKVQNRVPHSPPVYGIIKTSANPDEIEITGEKEFVIYLNPKDTAGLWGVFNHQTTIISDQTPPLLFNVRFFNYDGALLKSEEVYDTFDATPPADPTRPNGPPAIFYPSDIIFPDNDLFPLTGKGEPTVYVFVGWDKPYTSINMDRDIWAVYKHAGQYTVRFLDDDGTVLSIQAVNYGAGAVAPPDPVKEDREFTGWSDSFNIITADKDIYAVYRVELAVYAGCIYCGESIARFDVGSPIGG